MPNNVEERIVEMRIDHQKFEAGAKKTISLLESLDRGLNKLGQQNADGFDTVADSLNKVTDRFSAMGIVGDQVIRNLTNKAMELVSQLKSVATELTSKQVGAGWDKYAEKTQAIQTIMAATSKKIDEGIFANQAEQMEWVNEQIQKLNWFTDETSYNFLDMVGNIGKFTANGRELEESVTAMQGIATWAAISGGRVQEASRAMYNLSQALGMGAVTQKDWMSIENANMATYEFKEQVIQTAEELGRLRKVEDGVWEDMEGNIVTVESFRENLKDKWFDNDVLLDVLQKYGSFTDELNKVTDKYGYTATQFLHYMEDYANGNKNLVPPELIPDIQRLSAAEYDLGRRAFIAAQEAKTFKEAIDATKDAVSTGWMDIFEMLFGDYLEAKKLWTDFSEMLYDVFAEPVNRIKEILDVANNISSYFPEFAQSMGAAERSTDGLKDRLAKVGKTMDDFGKAVYTVADRATIDMIENFRDVEDALLNGAISADLFREALGVLDDSYGTDGTVSLNRALNKAGKTMKEFEKAVYAVSDRATIDMIENFGSVEDAVKAGVLSIEQFQEALAQLGIDGENVSATVEESARGSIASLEDLREVATAVLAGDFKNGEERRQMLEELGYDYEVIQAMAGQLADGRYQWLDNDTLVDWMEQWWYYNGMAEQYGFETFAEYLAAANAEMEDLNEASYDFNKLADESEQILAEIYGNGIFGEGGEIMSAGELLREGLKNLMTFFDNLATAFNDVILKVFSGAENTEKAIESLGFRFWNMAAAFYSFTENIQLVRKTVNEAGEEVIDTSRLDRLTAALELPLRVIRLIGKALSVVFRVGKIVLKTVFIMLTPVFNLLSDVFGLLTGGLNRIDKKLEDSKLLSVMDEFATDVATKLEEPLQKVYKVITEVSSAFRTGFETDGLTGAFQKVDDAIHTLFQNHPMFLEIYESLKTVFRVLGTVVEGLGTILLTVFGGIFSIANAAFQALFGSVEEGAEVTAETGENLTVLQRVLNALTETFGKVERVLTRVFDYMRKGYEADGLSGAFNALVDSFERGVRRLVPGGDKIVDFIEKIRKSTDETMADVEENLIPKSPLTGEVETTWGRIQRVIGGVIDGIFGNEEQRAATKENIRAFIGNVWQGILAGLRDIKLRDVLSALRLGVIASIAGEIISAITIFKQVGTEIKSIPVTLKDGFNRLLETFRVASISFQANAVLKLAASTLLIAFAIAKLAKIPKSELEYAASIVLIVIGILAAIIRSLSKSGILSNGIGNFKIQNIQIVPELVGLLFGLGSLVASLGFAVGALALVQKWGGDLTVAGKTIGVLVGGIAVILIGVSLLAKLLYQEDIAPIGKLLVQFGASLLLFSFAVQSLALPILALTLVQKWLEPNQLATSVASILFLLIILAGMMAVVIVAAKGMKAKQIREVGFMLLKAAGAMMLMALAVQMLMVPIGILILAQTKASTEAFNAAVLTVAGFVIGLAVLIGIYSDKLSKYSNVKEIGKSMMRVAFSMILFAVAVGMIAGPIIRVAKLSQEIEEKHIFGALAYLLGTIAVFALVLGVMDSLKINGGNLIKIAGAIALLSVSMLLIVPALLLLAGAGAVLAAWLSTWDNTTWEEFEKGLERLGKLSSKLALFGLSLLVIAAAATLGGAGIIACAIGVAAFVGALALLMIALPSFIDMLVDLKETTEGDIIRSLGKVAIAIVGISLSVGILLLALTGLFKLFKLPGLKSLGTSIANLLSGIGKNIRKFASDSVSSITSFFGNKENKDKILGAVTVLITLAGTYIAGLIPTLVDTVFGSVVTLIDSVAAQIDDEQNRETLVTAITNLLHGVLEIVGDLFTKLFSEEFQSSLSPIASGLFTIGVVLSALGVVAAGLNLANSFISLKNAIRGADGVMGALGEAEEGINKVSAASLLLNPVVDMLLLVAASAKFAYDNIGQQQDILRRTAFEGLGDSAEDYIVAMNRVQAVVDNLQEAADNGSTEFGLTQELDAQKLLLKTLENEYKVRFGDLQTEADLIETVTEATETESDAVNSTVEDLNNLTEAIKIAQNEINRLENLSPAERGPSYNKDLEVTKAQLAILEEKYSELIDTAEDANDVIEESANFHVDDRGAGAANPGAPKEGWLHGTREAAEEATEAVEELGETSAFTFGTIVSQFTGGSMGNFGAAIGGFDITGAFKEAFAKQGFNMDDLLSGGLSFDSIKDKLNIDQLKADAKSALTTAMTSVGIAIPEGIGLGIGEGGSEATGAMGTFIDEIIDQFLTGFNINSPSRVMADHAKAIPEGVAQGIESGSNLAVAATAGLAVRVVTAFGDAYGSFYGKGVNLVQGLVDGISANFGVAYETGASLAASVQNGFTDALAIQSPSRVFMRLAQYIPAGISLGIQQNQQEAVDSVVVLSTALVDAITAAMAKVSVLADENYEFSPTITPVVDLSNVNAVSGSLSRAFGGSYGVSAQMSGSINARLRDVERLASSMEGAGQTINNNGDSITFNIYASEGMDEEAIADAVMNRMQTRMVRRGAAFG